MADCKTCKEKRSTDGDQYAADIVAANAETANRRMFIIWIITFLLLVGTNAFWIWRDSQFEDVVTTQTVEQETDGDGDNTFVGGDYNGSAESDYDNENQSP